MRRALRWCKGMAVWLWATPAALAVVLATFLGGAAAGVPVSNELYNYTWRDPRFCDDCHVHDYANEAWAASAHARLTTCHDCHRVPIRHYPRNLVLALFDRPQVPEDIPKPDVPIVTCEQCHSAKGAHEPLTGPMPAEVRAQVVRIDASPLHRWHLDAETRSPAPYQGGDASGDDPGSEGTIGCLDCHGGENTTAHQFPATSASCEQCHEGIRPTDEGGGALSCLDCHARGFIAGLETGEE